VVRWRRCGAIAGVAGGQRCGAGARVAGAGSVVWRKEDGWHCQGRREPHRKMRARGDRGHDESQRWLDFLRRRGCKLVQLGAVRARRFRQWMVLGKRALGSGAAVVTRWGG
jgi:hypothetical protein